jgi:hypothetical protein
MNGFSGRLQIPEALRAWGDPGKLTLKDYVPRTQAYVSRFFKSPSSAAGGSSTTQRAGSAIFMPLIFGHQ